MEYIDLAKKFLSFKIDQINAYNRLDYLIMTLSYLKNNGLSDANGIKHELAEFMCANKSKKDVLYHSYIFDIEKADELTVVSAPKTIEAKELDDTEDVEYDEDFLKELGVENN